MISPFFCVVSHKISRMSKQPAKPGIHSKQKQLASRQAIGVLLLAGFILLAALLRARTSEVFPLGWWRW
jgi:hypothetical protein